MTVRPARHADAGPLTALALRSKAYWGYDEAFMAACVNELTVTPSDIDCGATFVVERAGEVAGYYALSGVDDATAELDALFVDPPWIGTGCGRALMDHARRRAKQLGFAVMVIVADPNAEAFYRAMGATPVGTRPSESIANRALPVLLVNV